MLEKFRELICSRVDIDASNIHPESLLVEDLSLSSYDLMDMISDIERIFGVEIEEEGASKIITIQDAIEYISKLQTEKE